MKISYNWLRELVEIPLAPKELADQLTMAGLAVEVIEPHGDDYIFEFDLTSNRPDALCHIGIAREVAAICDTKLKTRQIIVNEDAEEVDKATSIEILDADLCPRYAARVIRGVKVAPSPDWLVKKLESIGQRSVNNIADITNFVMFEMGQPTHAFDLNLLREKRIEVRRAREGETIKTLDGVERKLSTEMCVIADAERPIAIGGVMGGEETEINANTTDVLLESAYFTPSSIRSTSRILGLSTEASYRYERGVDYDSQVRVADYVATLIAEIAGGKVLKGALDVYPAIIEREAVRLREERIEKLTGLKISLERADKILKSLGFVVAPFVERRELIAMAPSFRVDIFNEEDLIEEVARHFGYDNIQTTLPVWGGAGSYLEADEKRRKVRSVLTDYGFYEAISFSFVSGERDRFFRDGNYETAKLANPIDVNEDEMRASLMTGLLGALQRNFNYGRRDVKLFELGRVFKATQDSTRPSEREVIGLLMSGAVVGDTWRGERQIDFYDMKGIIENVMNSLNISGFTIDRTSVEYLHPGQAAVLIRDGEILARFGRLHPKIASLYKFRQNVFVGEIEFEKLLAYASDEVHYKPLAKFPGISRDISALVPESFSWGEIAEAVHDLQIREVVAVKVFDLYRGKELPPETRSLAFRITYRSDERTLTDSEVSEMHSRIREMLAQRFSTQFR